MAGKRRAGLRCLLLVPPLLAGLFSQTVARAEAPESTSTSRVLDIREAEVRQYISAGLAAATEQNFNVVVGENIEVPQDVLQSVRDSGTTLALHTGNGMAFSITRDNVTKAMLSSGLDLRVVVGEDIIPEELTAQKTAIALLFKEIGMISRSAFGGVVNMHWALGSENGGKFANLYHYNEVSGQLEYVSAYVIHGDGQAMFPIVNGANYLVTVTDTKPNERMVPAGGKYVAVKGDTLSGIAGKYGISLREVLGLNPEISDPDILRIGQNIRLQ